ncbi:putative methylesterase 11, chloroplastic [Euphorbia lathyris]|uniref:putative methylesterase 11, chloroplastic n=1 Tax=Euphorbia lathyris TaxID=212925 RepID=UPI003313C9C1
MGNALACISSHEVRKKAEKDSKLSSNLPLPSSFSFSSSSFSKKQKDVDDELLAEAVAAAMLLRQHQRNGSLSLPFPRSSSVAYQNQGSIKKCQTLQKSSTSRHSSSSSSSLDQDVKIEEVGRKHFILVHGGGFGAWCWYKIITLLEESGCRVDAVDLTSDSHTNPITTLSEYTKPLIDILQNLKEGEKVILVGHDIGGACISHVMELFPDKIDKSVFISATMLSNAQSALHILSQQTDCSDLIRQAQVFVYGNGKDNPPTSIDLNKDFLRDLLFNKCSNKDIALALVSMRPIPFSPILEKVVLSDNKYGSVPRFYIKAEEDCAIPVSLQEEMIKSNPPKQVFQLKASDHAPFFSKPQALHRILLHISNISSN